jgi:hypothetical protein
LKPKKEGISMGETIEMIKHSKGDAIMVSDVDNTDLDMLPIFLRVTVISIMHVHCIPRRRPVSARQQIWRMRYGVNQSSVRPASARGLKHRRFVQTPQVLCTTECKCHSNVHIPTGNAGKRRTKKI